MIGSLRGKLLGFEGIKALIEVQGVGYEVEIPGNLLTEFVVGEECFVYTHFVVREDAQLLYGFKSKEARLLFRELIKINGVGPKVGMALLSCFDLKTFIEVINQNRINALISTPGVGKKTAERIIVEMKDRLDKLRIMEAASVSSVGTTAVSNGLLPEEESSADDSTNAAFVCEDAVMALKALGFTDKQAIPAVKSVYENGMTTEQVLKATLAILSSKSRR
ncbi:Holliday junction branch migration protein RuvA [Anaerobiospirillum succiniciproducens]|uniref:Holliday junction branch migration protein RuvA n=1 Tax=Anaerobiospirillum succiniciproducens TaxID=13335 RepID=UPI00248EB81E|nr:Holliday junction branch migration protein RuvA [Anaerobiospirillum succiniciproducens]